MGPGSHRESEADLGRPSTLPDDGVLGRRKRQGRGKEAMNNETQTWRARVVKPHHWPVLHDFRESSD